MDWLRSLARPSERPNDPSNTRYEAIPDSESGSPLSASTTARPHVIIGEDREVYWCFWVLGAGVLLGWNGESQARHGTGKLRRQCSSAPYRCWPHSFPFTPGYGPT